MNLPTDKSISGPGSGRSVYHDSMSSTRLWADILAEGETKRNMRAVHMSAVEWRDEINRRLRCCAPGQILHMLETFMAIKAQRAELTILEAPIFRDVDWELWKDMVEEPWKYGDSIVDWLELDEEMCAGPNADRVALYWNQSELELTSAVDEEERGQQLPWKVMFSPIAKEAARHGERKRRLYDARRIAARFNAAVRTCQAAIRGHHVRTTMPVRDCCMCLAHRICPIQTDVGRMCTACAEQGPYEDSTGPLSDPWNWHRATKA